MVCSWSGTFYQKISVCTLHFMAENDVKRFESKSIETFDSLPGSYHVDSYHGSLPV